MNRHERRKEAAEHVRLKRRASREDAVIRDAARRLGERLGIPDVFNPSYDARVQMERLRIFLEEHTGEDPKAVLQKWMETNE